MIDPHVEHTDILWDDVEKRATNKALLETFVVFLCLIIISFL